MDMGTKRIILIGCLTVLVIGVGLLNSGLLSFEDLLAKYPGYSVLESSDLVLQAHQNDCGPAALLNVFRKYRIPSSLKEIKRIAGTNGKGTSMLGLKRAVELKGLEAQGWLYTWEDFQQAPLPMIAFVRGNHYVVVESITESGSVIVLDPAIGRLQYRLEKFRRIWRGEALQIGRADSFESALSPEGYR